MDLKSYHFLLRGVGMVGFVGEAEYFGQIIGGNSVLWGQRSIFLARDPPSRHFGWVFGYFGWVWAWQAAIKHPPLDGWFPELPKIAPFVVKWWINWVILASFHQTLMTWGHLGDKRGPGWRQYHSKWCDNCHIFPLLAPFVTPALSHRQFRHGFWRALFQS